jgi:hypothetical protein
MSDAAAAITAICQLVDKIGTWPIASLLFFIIIGPWIMSFLISYNQQKRFEKVIEMYKNNVKLVEAYSKMSDSQQDVITLNTAKWQEAIDGIKTNQFCPTNRTEKIRMENVR